MCLIRYSQIYVTATFTSDALLFSQVLEIANQTLQPIRHLPGLAYALAYQPIPRIMMSHSMRSGRTALGLNSEDGSLVLALLSISWTDRAHDTAGRFSSEALCIGGRDGGAE